MGLRDFLTTGKWTPVPKGPSWLELEEAKPRTYLFIVIAGEEIKLGHAEPIDLDGDSNYGIRMTSSVRAERMLKNAYERGYFEDEAGITYPVYSVQKAYLK